MTAHRPADPGLQAERTLLAWRRTCLSLAVGYVIWIRVLATSWGAVAVVLGVLALAAAALSWSLPTLRYRRWHARLHTDPRGFRVGGAPMAALALTAALAGIFSLAVFTVV